jgi:hypothetical protein
VNFVKRCWKSIKGPKKPCSSWRVLAPIRFSKYALLVPKWPGHVAVIGNTVESDDVEF